MSSAKPLASSPQKSNKTKREDATGGTEPNLMAASPAKRQRILGALTEANAQVLKGWLYKFATRANPAIVFGTYHPGDLGPSFNVARWVGTPEALELAHRIETSLQASEADLKLLLLFVIFSRGGREGNMGTLEMQLLVGDVIASHTHRAFASRLAAVIKKWKELAQESLHVIFRLLTALVLNESPLRLVWPKPAPTGQGLLEKSVATHLSTGSPIEIDLDQIVAMPRYELRYCDFMKETRFVPGVLSTLGLSTEAGMPPAFSFYIDADADERSSEEDDEDDRQLAAVDKTMEPDPEFVRLARLLPD